MKHVLIVDDEPHMRRALRAYLEWAGLGISTASTAEEALRVALECPPDVVVCDWHLGMGDSGVRLAQALRAQSPGIGILLISGMSERDLAEPLSTLGLDTRHALAKPFTGSALLARLHQCFS